MRQNAFKQGATSIYVVVISTLLFSVITFSFVRIIINEATKTTSDELAQAAYDSALAGIEDAKTALKRYYECIEADDSAKPDGCDVIEPTIKNGFKSSDPNDSEYNQEYYCDSVSKALGRFDTGINDNGVREVLIQEQSKTGGDRANIVQAYTCVVVDNTLDDYRSKLSTGTPVRVVPLKTNDPDSVTGIRILWYAKSDGNLNYANENAYTPIVSDMPTPPTLSAEIIQTGSEFKLDSFDSSSGNTTNRGTVILTPAKNSGTTHVGRLPNDNSITVLANSNDHSYERNDAQNGNYNKTQKIQCQAGLSEEFACVASIEIPKPLGDVARNRDTFFLILSLPYSGPTTTFAVQLCNDAETGGIRGDCMDNGAPSVAKFTDVQISVDSTGRANDMYSRLEARIELSDIYFPFPEFTIHATGDGDDSLKKNFYVTSNCIDSDDPNNIKDCPDTN